MDQVSGRASIVDAFLSHAKRSPDSTALASSSEQITYQQLYVRSCEVAHALCHDNASRTQRVAIVAERCTDFVVSLIGATLSGAAFVVLDSGYPDERLKQLIGLCRPDRILVAGDTSLQHRCQALALAVGLPMFVVDDILRDGATPRRVAPSDVAQGVHDLSEKAPQIERRDHDVAYYLFTSGSTGVPKCVAVSHAPLIHFVAWHIEHAGMTREDRFSLASGLSHDPVLRDVFTPLSIGARLEIPSQHTILAPGQLRTWFFVKRISVTHLTPSMGRLLFAQERDAPVLTALRRLFWGGERLTLDVVKQLHQVAPHARQSNFYGATETPQAICHHEIDEATAAMPLPIGRPVEGFDVFVADENGIGLPVRRTGELCVRSPFLSLGYLRDGEIVSERVNGIYRTGDFGERDEAGNLIVTGRRDDQVKIRGYRIDLNEVSAQLAEIANIAWCTTLGIEDAGGQRLESFVKPVDAHAWSAETVQAAIAARVPAYMVPTRYHVLPDGPPLLPNGKVDRLGLIAMAKEPARDDEPHATPVYSSCEANLIEKWVEVFPAQRLTARSSFKSLGGDSLSMVDAYLAAEALLGQLPTNWADLSITELARIQSARATRGSSMWAWIDSTIAVRCIAILMIVGYHFNVLPMGKGLTGAFFLIAGYMFGTLKMPADIRDFRASASLAAIKRILLPTLFFALVMSTHDFVSKDYLPVPLLLFFANLVDYEAPSQGYFQMMQGDALFWYADCLLQMIAITVVAAVLVKRLSPRAVSLAGFAFWLLLVGLIFRFALPVIDTPQVLQTGIDHMDIHQLNPLSNLAIFALGMGLVEWTRRAGRVWPTVVILLFGVLDAVLYGVSNGASIMVAVFCVLYMPRVRVPRFTVGFFREIASAALYIYLAQYMFASVANKILGVDIPAVDIAVAIGGGVVVSKMWPTVERSLEKMRELSLRILSTR